MRKPINELKGAHQGEDIWIVATGPSAEFVDPAFFANKLTLGVNRVWLRFKTDYLVVKDNWVLQDCVKSGAKVIASRHNCGNIFAEDNQVLEGVHYFDHRHNQLTTVDLDLLEDEIVVSYSTITSAMHLAAYMGAANIILVGHDCGMIDGQTNINGYPGPIISKDGFYEQFLSEIEPQSVLVRAWLQERYGCLIYSLNPWLNFGLEGHKYERQSESA